MSAGSCSLPRYCLIFSSDLSEIITADDDDLILEHRDRLANLDDELAKLRSSRKWAHLGTQQAPESDRTNPNSISISGTPGPDGTPAEWHDSRRKDLLETNLSPTALFSETELELKLHSLLDQLPSPTQMSYDLDILWVTGQIPDNNRMSRRLYGFFKRAAMWHRVRICFQRNPKLLENFTHFLSRPIWSPCLCG